MASSKLAPTVKAAESDVTEAPMRMDVSRMKFMLGTAASDAWKDMPQAAVAEKDVYDGMRNVKQLRDEYARELKSIGFLGGSVLETAANVNSGSIRMVSAALCAALCPRRFWG